MAEKLEYLLETGDKRVRFTLSETSGTSVYMIVFLCEDSNCVETKSHQLLGAILPENSSTKVLGEIFSYNLARVLDLAEYYGPGVHLNLKGKGLKKFRKMIMNAAYNEHKEKNRKTLIDLTRNREKLHCAYKKWGSKPVDLEKLILNNSVNKANILIKYIQSENKKPDNEFISLSSLSHSNLRGNGKALDLARQLSGIMVIDMLTGQWDRFSGGNLQATIKNGNVKLASFDNGGTFSYSKQNKWFTHYKKILTRFDKKIVKCLNNMNNFLNIKNTDSFLNYSSENEFRGDMGIITGPDNLANADWVWKMFKRNLSMLIEHVKQVEERYGAELCYF